MRTRTAIALFAASCALPAQPPRVLVGRVTSDAHGNLAHAKVAFHPVRRSPWTQLADWPTAARAPMPQHTRTNQRGTFGIPIPASLPAQGALLVTQSDVAAITLGALVFVPRSPLVVRCRPVGEVRFDDPATVHVQALDPRGGPIYLGSFEKAQRLALPEGEYRLLVRGARHDWEQRLTLRPRQKVRLREPDSEDIQILRPPLASTWLTLRHWPEVRLSKLRLARTNTPNRILIHTPIERGVSVREAWVDHEASPFAGHATPRVQPLQVVDENGDPVPNAEVISVRDSPDDAVLLDSVARTDERGRASYDAPKSDFPAHIIVSAPGFVPQAIQLTGDAIGKVVLTAGQRLRLQVQDPRGNPAAHIGVEFTYQEAPLLRAVLRTDERGSLTSADLPGGRMTVRLLGPKMLDAPHPLSLASGEANQKSIRARPGFSVRGRVVHPEGTPAAGAVVIARELPTRPDARVRTTTTAADGSFVFHGLAENARIRLSARATTAKGELISTRAQATPGADSIYLIELKSEDPRFPGRRGPRKRGP